MPTPQEDRSPAGAGRGYRRPVVIVEADAFGASRIATVLVAAVTASRRLAAAPGNVWLARDSWGLDRDAATHVTPLPKVDRSLLLERIGTRTGRKLCELDDGLRQVLAPQKRPRQRTKIAAWAWRTAGDVTISAPPAFEPRIAGERWPTPSAVSTFSMI
jgi:mRNA interferase MazF